MHDGDWLVLMLLERGDWHLEWKLSVTAKENLVHDLVSVYDWIMLPQSVGEKMFRTGTIDLSQFPCHQLNGSFCALSAMRKTVQWFNQGCFDMNAASVCWSLSADWCVECWSAPGT